MAKVHYQSEQYQRNRKRVLAGNPGCTYCGAPADTVDHVVALAHGGSHAMSNLVPACRSCNSSRGGKLTAERGKRSNPDARTESIVPVLRKEKRTPDRPMLVSLAEPEPERTGADRVELDREAPIEAGPDGLIPPRLETRTVSTGTWGPRVADWSERVLGVRFQPWQAYAADRILGTEVDPATGVEVLAIRRALVSTPRQSGKSTLLAAVIGWAMTELPTLTGRPTSLLSTAHTLDLATSTFLTVAPHLETLGGTPRWSYGRNEIRLDTGHGESVWRVRAATPQAAHGVSSNLVIADEIWSISSAVLDDALRPTMRAQRNPLMLMVSTAGDESSEAFIRYREEALRLVDSGEASRFAFLEWSPKPSADPMHPDTWRQANPAVAGGLIPLEVIEEESRNPNQAAFRRASLNMWVASARETLLPPGVWDTLRSDETTDLGPPTVLALDSSIDGETWCGVGAWVRPGGHVVVDAMFLVETEGRMWEEVDQAVGPRTQLAITPHLELHLPDRHRHRKTLVGFIELARWTSVVRSAMLERKVSHRGASLLSEHVERAVVSPARGGLVINSQRSPGPVTLARCAVWAIALASRPAGRRPSIGGSNNGRRVSPNGRSLGA